MKKTLILSLLLFTCSPALAGDRSDELSSLKRDLAALMSRVERLEAENERLKTTAPAETATVVEKEEPSWTDSIAVSGDLRYRYEHIDSDTGSDRERNRVRARVAVTATLTDNVRAGIGLASGSDDPVSSNQTLGNGGSTKDIRLNLAYMTWQAKPGFSITAGKMKNPWYRPGGSELIWDGDLNPEGLAFTWERNDLFVTGVASFLESDTRNGSETIMYGVQAGLSTDAGPGRLSAGLGYLEAGVSGKGVFFGDDDDFFGNSFACTVPAVLSSCAYVTDYSQAEMFAEYAVNISGMPVSLYADAVRNLDADRFDTGWIAGIRLGKAKRRNSWEMSYSYQDLEADAVLGLTTGSDFGGGGTDARGHVIKGAWAVNSQWKLSLTYFDNERGEDLGTGRDYSRLQLDTAFKF